MLFGDKNDMVHILFQIHDENEQIFCNELNVKTFEDVTSDFIRWYEETEKGKNIHLCP
jgi:hypothetical protein